MNMHYINLKQMQIEKGLAAVQLKKMFPLLNWMGLSFLWNNLYDFPFL